jgi:simple sugar transport system ATP-binding protein
MMVGREVLLRVEKKAPDVGDVLLEVRDLSVRDERGLDVVRDVSLTVRRARSSAWPASRGTVRAS